MKDYKIRFIEIECECGETVGSAARKALQCVVDHQSNVRFQHNGRTYKVDYNDLLTQCKE